MNHRLLEFKEHKNVICISLGVTILVRGREVPWLKVTQLFCDRAQMKVKILGISVLFSVNISQSQFVSLHLQLAPIIGSDFVG